MFFFSFSKKAIQIAIASDLSVANEYKRLGAVVAAPKIH